MPLAQTTGLKVRIVIEYVINQTISIISRYYSNANPFITSRSKLPGQESKRNYLN